MVHQTWSQDHGLLNPRFYYASLYWKPHETAENCFAIIIAVLVFTFRTLRRYAAIALDDPPAATTIAPYLPPETVSSTSVGGAGVGIMGGIARER